MEITPPGIQDAGVKWREIRVVLKSGGAREEE
jgi:hypothetical protein